MEEDRKCNCENDNINMINLNNNMNSCGCNKNETQEILERNVFNYIYNSFLFLVRQFKN